MSNQEQIDFYHLNRYVRVEEAVLVQELALLQQVTAGFIVQSRYCIENAEEL